MLVLTYSIHVVYSNEVYVPSTHCYLIWKGACLCIKVGSTPLGICSNLCWYLDRQFLLFIVLKDIMAYGSTPYVGTAPNKNGGNIKSAHMTRSKCLC